MFFAGREYGFGARGYTGDIDIHGGIEMTESTFKTFCVVALTLLSLVAGSAESLQSKIRSIHYINAAIGSDSHSRRVHEFPRRRPRLTKRKQSLT